MKHSIDYLEWCLWFLGGVSVFFVEIYGYMVALLIMVVCDTAIKIMAVKKELGWGGVTSRKMRVGIVTKLIGYVAVIIGFHACEFFIDNTIPLTKLVTYILAMIELKSISENFEQISGTSIWKYAGAYIQSKMPVIEEEKDKE